MTTNSLDDPEHNVGVQAAMIAEQNDSFRKAMGGFPDKEIVPRGRLVMTQGVDTLGPEVHMLLLERLAQFNDFTMDNDPHGWHEFGEIHVNDERIWFKIDLYDEDYDMGSEVPHDPEKTRRVLTLLLPSEY